jgi:hypothetical protein
VLALAVDQEGHRVSCHVRGLAGAI